MSAKSEPAFNRAFKREFGLPPGQYRKKVSGLVVLSEDDSPEVQASELSCLRYALRWCFRKRSFPAIRHP